MHREWLPKRSVISTVWLLKSLQEAPEVTSLRPEESSNLEVLRRCLIRIPNYSTSAQLDQNFWFRWKIKESRVRSSGFAITGTRLVVLSIFPGDRRLESGGFILVKTSALMTYKRAISVPNRNWWSEGTWILQFSRQSADIEDTIWLLYWE